MVTLLTSQRRRNIYMETVVEVYPPESAPQQNVHAAQVYDYWRDKWAEEYWSCFTDTELTNQLIEIAGFRLRANGYAHLSAATIETNMQQGLSAMEYAAQSDVYRCLYFFACQKLRYDCPDKWKSYVHDVYVQQIDSITPTLRLPHNDIKYTTAYIMVIQSIILHIKQTLAHEASVAAFEAAEAALLPVYESLPELISPDTFVVCWKHGKHRRVRYMTEYPVGSGRYQCSSKTRCYWKR